MSVSKKDMKKWVDALRSSDYKQCTNQLHDGVGYCCLGVMAKVVYGNKDTYLMDGLPDTYSRLEKDLKDHGIYSEALISMNDEGNSFEKIADYIEGEMK